MTYRIVQYPQEEALLRRTGVRVEHFDSDFQQILDKIVATLLKAKDCAGLAATQLDMPNAPYIAVIDAKVVEASGSDAARTLCMQGDSQNDTLKPLCLINPKIVKAWGSDVLREGTLSIHNRKGKSISGGVERATHIVVEAQDRYGNPITLQESKFIARVIQHEIDHLEGKLFIDLISGLRRKNIERKIRS